MKTESFGMKVRIGFPLNFVSFHIAFSFSAEHHEVKSALLRTPQFGYADFIHHPYSKLDVVQDNIPLKYAGHAKECALGCAKNFTCKSFNFGTQPIFLIHNKAQYICQLLPTDKYNSSSKFVSFHGDYHHYSIRSECRKSPCMYDNTCVPNYYEDTYKCLCSRPGLVGRHCRDIDECTSKQSNCSVNATCTNTIGSYTCTCKQGYFGDGRDCSIIKITSEILHHYGNQTYHNDLWDFIQPTVTPTSQWVRCWWASNDGWDVSRTFHRQCDNKGPTLTIIRKNSYVYGGYIDQSWTETNPNIYSTNAFLFSLFNIRGYHPIKLIQKSHSQKAAYYYSYWGPTFGGGYDIKIENFAGTESASSSTMSSYFAPPGCSDINSEFCNFFNNVAGPTTLSDVEVFYLE